MIQALEETVINSLEGARIAIVGAGKFGKMFIQFLMDEAPFKDPPKILGVADKSPDAPGLTYARAKGIFCTINFNDLLKIDRLDIVIELTRDPSFSEAVRSILPESIKFIDHFDARFLWDVFQLEKLKRRAFQEMEGAEYEKKAMQALMSRLVDQFITEAKKRIDRSREVEMDLARHEQTTSQIIYGSTIPTFVINKDHIITHWNKAAEGLTGYAAFEMVGTNRQWEPFYESERPTMADLILDQVDEADIEKLYGTKYRKSSLIQGGYEAEDYFPDLGGTEKWCWFTAAPIKAPDGTIIGAIETLWDKTEDKYAEQERERHAREMTCLCSIYTALSSPGDIDKRISSAIDEIRYFLAVDSVCVFLRQSDGSFKIKYTKNFCQEQIVNGDATDMDSLVHLAADGYEPLFVEKLADKDRRGIPGLDPNIKSLVYIPISVKEKSAIGVIRLGSRIPTKFDKNEKRVMELIGNRFGVAIENARLQEQVMRSEEKYRSLFNNDPNPIFIIDCDTLRIQDINQRAMDCYGYGRNELIGMRFTDLGDQHDPEVEKRIKDLSRDESVLFSKKRHYRKGNKPFYVNINVSHAVYRDQNVLIASTTDITESIEKETQLIQAGKMTTLGVMAAGMAHEINQPLNVIQICADFILKLIHRGQEINPQDLEMMAKDIIANVDRATNVIKHVRSFARQSEVVASKVIINDPIMDVFKILGHQIKNHNIQLTLDLSPDLPPILAEHNRLEQVFINLVSNAIDAMDEKEERAAGENAGEKVEKHLTIKSFFKDQKVVVTVSDTGIGMTEEVKNKIFEPFFTTKKTGKGTGLGTSISYGIIKDYKGSIAIDSCLGKGTTFTIEFPVAT